MSFLGLILHNINARRVRSVITAVAVAFGVATVITLGVVTSSIRESAAAILSTGSADFTVAQKGVADVMNSSMGAEEVAAIQNTPGVETAVGALIATVPLDPDHPIFIRIVLPATDLDVFGVKLLGGRPYTDRATGEMMLGYRAAQDLGKEVGDTLVVDGDTYTVVGLFSTGNAIGDSASMFPLVPLQAALRLPGNVTLIFARVTRGTEVDRLRTKIERDNPQLITVRLATEFGRVDRNLQLITAVDRASTPVALVIGAVIVMNTMLLSFFERTREFGLLRALGWSRRRVMVLVIGEALVISIGGAGIGVGLSFLGVRILQRLPELRGILEPQYSNGIFGRALFLAGGMALFGAIYPALRAAFMVPLEALRRE